MCAQSRLIGATRAQLRRHDEPPLRMPLNPVDAAMHEIHAAAERAERHRQRAEIGLVARLAGVAHVEQNVRVVVRHGIQARGEIGGQVVHERAQQRLRRVMTRIAEHAPDGPGLHDFARLDHRDRIADLANHVPSRA